MIRRNLLPPSSWKKRWWLQISQSEQPDIWFLQYARNDTGYSTKWRHNGRDHRLNKLSLLKKTSDLIAYDVAL
jgi:hypothetical protein